MDLFKFPREDGMRLHAHPEMLKLVGWNTHGWIRSSAATGPDIPSMNAQLTDVRYLDERLPRHETLNLIAVEEGGSFYKTYENQGSRSFFRRLWHLLDKNKNKTLSEIQHLDVPDYETVAEFLRGRGEWYDPCRSWQITGRDFIPTPRSIFHKIETQQGFPRRLIVTAQTTDGYGRGTIDTTLSPKEMSALLAVLNKSIDLTWVEIAEKTVPFQG